MYLVGQFPVRFSDSRTRSYRFSPRPSGPSEASRSTEAAELSSTAPIRPNSSASAASPRSAFLSFSRAAWVDLGSDSLPAIGAPFIASVMNTDEGRWFQRVAEAPGARVPTEVLEDAVLTPDRASRNSRLWTVSVVVTARTFVCICGLPSRRRRRQFAPAPARFAAAITRA